MKKKKKIESTFKNMVLTLLIISGVAGLSLAFVHKITEEPIRKAQEAKLKNALSEVLPPFDTVVVKTVLPPSGKDSVMIYTALKDGEKVGSAVRTYTYKGFSGLIVMMVGFDAKGDIINTAILSHAETPGLGTKIESSNSDFPQQLKGKNPATFKLKVKQDGGDVDAITAATISSRAFCDAAQRAYDALKKEGGIEQ
jgi:electron transport complex protein RnfG